jgi:hypothetical protein
MPQRELTFPSFLQFSNFAATELLFKELSVTNAE